MRAGRPTPPGGNIGYGVERIKGGTLTGADSNGNARRPVAVLSCRLPSRRGDRRGEMIDG